MRAVISAREASANLERLIDEVGESHQPIVVAGTRGSAVLVSREDWDAIQETLYLLSAPQMRESIKRGMADPLRNTRKTIKW